jgi:hypothetical protein
MVFGKIFKAIGQLMMLPVMIVKLVLRFDKVGAGLLLIVEGVLQEVVEMPMGLMYLGIDLAVLVQAIMLFSVTNFFCGLKLMKNFTSCIIFYILDVVGKLFYLIPAIMFYILDKLGMGGYKMERTIWNKLEYLDRLSIDYIGFHIIHYSKSIREKCYNCKRLKTGAFIKKTTELANDLIDPILPMTTGGLMKMVNGFMQIAFAMT